MTIEELQSKLDSLIKGFPAGGFDSVSDNAITELNSYCEESGNLSMRSGQKLISNLMDAIKTRKIGGNTDESVQIRLVALDFYLKNLQNDVTEDL
jgi:hypothetical protein